MSSHHVTLAAAAARRQAERWGVMTWLTDAALVPGASLSLARMELAPGAAGPMHVHGNCDEVVTLLEGRVTALVEGREIVLRPGETCWVGRASAHALRNDGDGAAVLLLAYSAGARDYQVV